MGSIHLEEVPSLYLLTHVVNLNSSPTEALQIYSLVDMEEISVSKYHCKYHHPMASSWLGLVAQLVERRTSKPNVAGSNPSRGQVEFFSAYPVWVRFTWIDIYIPNLTERFPIDPFNFENATTFAEEVKKQLSELGPCQPLAHHLDGCTFPRTQFGKNRHSFQESWYRHILGNGTSIYKEWLEYSPIKDSMFCFCSGARLVQH